MFTNEILKEKCRVQKRLSKNSTTIHDYFIKASQAADRVLGKYSKTEHQKKDTPYLTVSENPAVYNSE
jgi:hypothetical protein